MFQKKFGILALQGAVEPHKKSFAKLGITLHEVRMPQDLDGITHLVLPGGESTTMIKLMKRFGLFDLLQNFMKDDSRRVWGICAGSILAASKVTNPAQESFNFINVEVIRNAYGRQLESFIDRIDLSPIGINSSTEAVFIRAPKFEKNNERDAKVINHGGMPVLVATKKVLITAFHPELTEDTLLHDYFAKM